LSDQSYPSSIEFDKSCQATENSNNGAGGKGSKDAARRSVSLTTGGNQNISAIQELLAFPVSFCVPAPALRFSRQTNVSVCSQCFFFPTNFRTVATQKNSLPIEQRVFMRGEKHTQKSPHFEGKKVRSSRF